MGTPRGPSPPPLFPLPGPPAWQGWSLLGFRPFQRAAGPGHRDGIGHRHVLPFPASEVHEDGLAAAGEVTPGGVWPGISQTEGCVNWGCIHVGNGCAKSLPGCGNAPGPRHLSASRVCGACARMALGLCAAQAAGTLHSTWAGGLRRPFSGQLEDRLNLECCKNCPAVWTRFLTCEM